jgi:dimethylamine monooxygenase subunit A
MQFDGQSMLKHSPHPRDLAPFLAKDAPRVQGSGLRMGLKALPAEAWLDQGALYPERLAAKKRVLQACPQSVQALPEAGPALLELNQLLGLPAHTSLALAGLTTLEDLCLLEPYAGTHRLTAATLAFPTDWHLSEKLGQPLMDIHAPITGYAGKLAHGVEHFFNTLQPGALFMRSNWFVVETDALRYLPTGPAEQRFAAIAAEQAGEALFLRCERQTLRRLPASLAVLFTIGVYLCPLNALSNQELGLLVQALESLPDFEFARREAYAFYPLIRQYAQARLERFKV